MANDLSVTAGAYTATIATDDVSGVHYQKMKLVDGTDDSSTMIDGSSLGLYTENHVRQAHPTAASSGLTTASTAYTTGDQVGVEFSLASAARVSGGSILITAIHLLDKSDIIGAYEAYFTATTITPASDNAAYSISDTDAGLVRPVQLGSSYDVGGARVCYASGLAVPLTLGATTLFCTLRCMAGHTFFGAATDLVLTVSVVQD